MDTSNNHERLTNQDLALSYIFGLRNHRITPAMLDPETWIQVAYHVLSVCSESLPYFHEMREARLVIPNLLGGMVATQIHYAPDSLTEKTRVTILCDLGSEKERLRSMSRKLLLTDGANLVECIMERRAYVSEVYGEEGKIIWNSTTVHFEKVDNDRFIELMVMKEDLVKLLCVSIKKVLDRGIERREAQLAVLHKTRDTIGRASLIL